MDSTCDNRSTSIPKKPLPTKDDSNKILHLTKKYEHDSDNKYNSRKASFFYKRSYQLSSSESNIPTSLQNSSNELFQPIICTNSVASSEISKENKQNAQHDIELDEIESSVMDKIILDKNLMRTISKLERNKRKQVLINIHPEMQASLYQRRKRLIVAAGIVLIAISIIITIIVYVIVMIVRQITQISQSPLYKYPRL